MQPSPKAGHYEEKLVRCNCPLISCSHRSRFRTAVKLVEKFQSKSVLDYGCGDGYFLSLLPGTISRKVGSDLNRSQLQNCRERFAGQNIDFVELSSLKQSSEQFDVVLCMEVLEHCEDHVVKAILDDCWKHCAADGRVILSVPVEVGMAGVLKWGVRKIAGLVSKQRLQLLRKISFSELIKTLFATPNTVLERTPVENDCGISYTHKGFDWRKLRREVETKFTIEKTTFTPFAVLGAQLNSQAWFICKRK